MATVDTPAGAEEDGGASDRAASPPGGSLPRLVDSTKLIGDPRDSAVVRASHRVYEHLVAMFAPGLIEAAFDLGAFVALADGPAGAAELAERLDADPLGVRVLLDGLSCYEIVYRESAPEGGHRYRLADGMAECLLPGGLYSLAGRIRYDRAIGWDAWRDLAQHVRHPARDDSGAYRANQLSAEDYESVARGINFWAPPIVEALAGLLTDTGWKEETPRSMLDVGCGTGIYSQLLLQRFKELTATGLDDPRIVPIAEEQAQRLNVGARFSPVSQDFFQQPWPGGQDLVLLVNIFHLQTADGAQELMHRARQAVREDGVVAIVDHIVDDDSEPHSPHNRFFRLFSASMLVTGGGDSFSLAEYDQWLERAGLCRTALVDTPMHRILLARLT
ncbi:hypothetical protein GCM10018980_72960 [Streptomyces capoamus]|uniref:Methyltransferase n=1 Tax=Streptomyces capoamus TaxID=68183 RepID=A0A919F477_9ACTN|nr:hypothetical protein GCM10018980_72960 [Streptomyces capoamus]